MERRKSEMFWKTLNLVVNLTFLLLAITIMTILLKNENYRTDFNHYDNALEELRQDINKVNQSNFMYLESKINRVASNVDSFQSNTTRRIEVIETRQKVQEERRSNGTRIVNSNSAIVNGVPAAVKE